MPNTIPGFKIPTKSAFLIPNIQIWSGVKYSHASQITPPQEQKGINAKVLNYYRTISSGRVIPSTPPGKGDSAKKH
jgi:hypothetical protein